jgi:3-oxoacyl-[acyl-carrier protein] reductase
MVNSDPPVAIVTGSGRGIGRAIALRLAREGYRLCLLSLHRDNVEQVKAEISEKYGHSVFGMSGDVADPRKVDEFVRRSIDTFGRIDALVNNAGVLHQTAFTDMTWPEWNRMISVHLHGTFLMTHAVVPYMLSRASGRVVNIASTSGITGGTSGAHYAAAKGGIIALTRALGKELAPLGLRVNAVAPSKIETNMLQDVKHAAEREELIHKIPVRRLGQPEDIADVVSFLLSNGASYIVGEVVVVAGGYG